MITPLPPLPLPEPMPPLPLPEPMPPAAASPGSDGIGRAVAADVAPAPAGVVAAPGRAPLRRALAFDSSTEHLSVALLVDGTVRAIEAGGGAAASAALLPAVWQLLGEAGLPLAGLEAIAFGRGPGAFTGLRVACAAAQGLAFGAGLPVLPIDTLAAVAEHALRLAADGGGRIAPDDTVWVVMDARMDEIYAAGYRRSAAGWLTLAPPRLTDAESLNATWAAAPPRWVAGSALGAFGERLRSGAAQRLPDALPRAAGLLALASVQWAQGGAVDAALALPLYLRDKVASTRVEREAARATKALAARAVP